MKYAYYPGCSLKATATHYDKSVLASFKALDIELVEIPDWNCCGATTYMGVDELKTLALSARNLAIAQKMDLEIVAPCNACYLNLLKAEKVLREKDEYGLKIQKALKKAGVEYNARKGIKIRHPLEIIVDFYGLDKLKTKIKRKLPGIRVVPYYGCQMTRPYDLFDHANYPVKLDLMAEVLGCDVVSDYPLKTKCCGASLSGTIKQVGLRANYLLLKQAKDQNADLIYTVCPLCQFNLEAYQSSISREFNEEIKMPILYFTQLLGVALGVDEKELGMNNLFRRYDFKEITNEK